MREYIMTEIVKIDGNIREETGSSATRRLRKIGRLPAVVYGDDNKNNIFIDLDIKEFEKEYFKGGIETKIFEITTPKKKYNVICYRMDLDPVSDRLRHIDFMLVDGKKEIKTLIPINYLNRDKAVGIKSGGYVNVLVRKLQVICDPKNIPSSIGVECSKLRLKQSVKISDLQLPNGVRPATKKDLLLVRVIGRGKDTSETTEATAAATATTAATPAAAAKTATPAQPAKK